MLWKLVLCLNRGGLSRTACSGSGSGSGPGPGYGEDQHRGEGDLIVLSRLSCHCLALSCLVL